MVSSLTIHFNSNLITEIHQHLLELKRKKVYPSIHPFRVGYLPPFKNSIYRQ